MEFSTTNDPVHTNGVTLNLVEAGDPQGQALLFMHGFPEFWYAWKEHIPYFAKQGYRILIPDQRGYNLSEKPKKISDYRLDNLASDMIGILDAKGIDKAGVIAHDWGGAVAWWMALKFPNRIRTLAVMNVPHPVIMRSFLKTNKKQRRKSRYMVFFQIPLLPEYLVKRNGFKTFETMLKKTSLDATFTEDDIAEYKKSWSQPGAIHAMINWYRAMARTKPARLESMRVSVPTLLIWGKKDRLLSHEMAEPSIGLCDQGELVYFEEATHWIHHEIPEKVDALIGKFLTKERKEGKSG